MKTTLFKHPWRVLAGMAALLLTGANLAAMPSVQTISGGPSYGHVNGSTSLSAKFHTPIGLAMDPSGGILYVADSVNNAIRLLDLGADYTYDFATAGITNPVGIAVDGAGNVYVLNRGNGRNGYVVRFDDFGDPYPLAVKITGLTNANGIALDRMTNIFVTASNTVLKFTPTGVKTTLATVTHKNASLQGITVQDDNWLAVCDYTSNGIVRINLNTGATTNLTGFNGPGDKFGTKAYAMFNHPYGIAAAGGGILVVADYSNNRVKVVDAAGTVTNLCGVASSFWVTGTGTYPGWWDGVVARGDVNYNAKGYEESRLPAGVCFASDGNVYTTEDYYHLIRKVTSVNLPPLPPPPPPAPVILTVGTNYGQVTLTWSPITGATNYNVKRSTSDGGPYTTIASMSGTSYTDTTVINGRTYFYVVSASSTGGEGPNSIQASAIPPLPPPPDPQIGYVDFPATTLPVAYTSMFHPVSSFVLNNDALLVIQGTPGSQTYYTLDATPATGSIPEPTSASYSAPVGYQDGMNENQVAIYAIGQIMPDLTIKAVAEKNDGSPNSAIVQARFQFVTANPTINGNNAAQFTLSDATANAHLFYTLDGSDPWPTNGVDLGTVGAPTNNWSAGFSIVTNTIFKVRAFRDHYQPSSTVSAIFSPSNFVANIISFGFASGEASSDFVGAPGQTFYAPVTLSVLPDAKMYSLQFNISVTNAGPNPGPQVTPGAYSFESFLEKPIPNVTPVVFEWIPPLMFSMYATDPPPANQIVTYDGNPAFVNMIVTNTSINLLGVGWLERAGATNLYNTLKQDLITYSQAHDTQFLSKDGRVIAGGYAFQIPPTAAPGQTYRIQVDRPSATSDGVGAPGSDVYIATPTNGSLTAGALNSIKVVTVGQRKYVAGDAYPFRWFNAGDFGDSKLDNPDVMQVFQSAIYGLNTPPPGSDFFDAMDACGGTYIDNGNGDLEFNNYVNGLNALFDGNDATINQIGFGDGILDVCDVYVTFRRSLDPSLANFQRFWTNGVLGAQIVGNPPPPPLAMAMTKSLLVQNPTNLPSVNFSSGDAIGSPGQVLQIPITAQMFGTYPLRVLMLNLSVVPLDGSPALTSPIQFTPNPALGQPALTSSMGNGNYAASWLDSTIAGLSGSAILGTLTVTIPANAPSSAAYAIHFDHASASPNGIASFPKQTMTGLITLSQRTNSVFGDAIPDSWRLRYFGTVNNVLSQANADADGDGVNNWQEYVAGTDPTDPKSRLNLTTGQAAAQPGKGCLVHWPSVAGKHYVIECSESLFPGSWTGISANTGTGTDMEFQDTTGGNVRFYRVQVVP